MRAEKERTASDDRSDLIFLDRTKHRRFEEDVESLRPRFFCPPSELVDPKSCSKIEFHASKLPTDPESETSSLVSHSMTGKASNVALLKSLQLFSEESSKFKLSKPRESFDRLLLAPPRVSDLRCSSATNAAVAGDDSMDDDEDMFVLRGGDKR